MFTVYDLRTTTREDRGEHEERLEVLVDSADALVTLTPAVAGAWQPRRLLPLVTPDSNPLSIRSWRRHRHPPTTNLTPRQGGDFR